MALKCNPKNSGVYLTKAQLFLSMSRSKSCTNDNDKQTFENQAYELILKAIEADTGTAVMFYFKNQKRSEKFKEKYGNELFAKATKGRQFHYNSSFEDLFQTQNKEFRKKYLESDDFIAMLLTKIKEESGIDELEKIMNQKQ